MSEITELQNIKSVLKISLGRDATEEEIQKAITEIKSRQTIDASDIRDHMEPEVGV